MRVIGVIHTDLAGARALVDLPGAKDVAAALRLAAFLVGDRAEPGIAQDVARAAARPGPMEVLPGLVPHLFDAPDRAVDRLIGAGPVACADALRARATIGFCRDVERVTSDAPCSVRAAGRALRDGPRARAWPRCCWPAASERRG